MQIKMSCSLKEAEEDIITIAEEEDVVDEVVKPAPWIKRFLVKVQTYGYNEPPLRSVCKTQKNFMHVLLKTSLSFNNSHSQSKK